MRTAFLRLGSSQVRKNALIFEFDQNHDHSSHFIEILLLFCFQKGYRPSDKIFTIRSDEGDEIEMDHASILWPNQTIVEIIGLQQDTTWNNRRGLILMYDHENGRYSVQMGQEDIIRVLPHNIRA